MAQTSTKNEAYSIAKKLIEKRELNPDILGGNEKEESECIIGFVTESLKKLAPINAMLKGDDLIELKGYELDGTIEAVDVVFNMLDAAVELHTSIH